MKTILETAIFLLSIATVASFALAVEHVISWAWFAVSLPLLCVSVWQEIGYKESQ